MCWFVQIFVLRRFTYTAVALLLIGSAALVWCAARSRGQKALAAVSLVLGILVRPGAAVSAIVLMLPALWLCRRASKKSAAVLLGIACLALLATHVSSALFFRSTESLARYNDWNAASTQVRDYPEVDYAGHQALMESLGWSENDYYMVSHWMFNDLDTFSPEKLALFSSSIPRSERFLLDPLPVAAWMLRERGILFFALAALGVLLATRPKEKGQTLPLILSLAMPMLLFAALIVRQRFVERVFIPLFALAWLQLILLTLQRELRPRAWLALLLLAPSLWWMGAQRPSPHPVSLESFQYGDVFDYIQAHEEDLFLMAPTLTNYIYKDVPVILQEPRLYPANAVDLGNWDSFGDIYYQKMSRVPGADGDHQFDSLLTGENVYLISVAEDRVQHIETYLREHVDEAVSYRAAHTFASGSAVYEFYIP